MRYQAVKTRSRLWGACWKVVGPNGPLNWGSPRDLIYWSDEFSARREAWRNRLWEQLQ